MEDDPASFWVESRLLEKEISGNQYLFIRVQPVAFDAGNAPYAYPKQAGSFSSFFTTHLSK